MPRARLVWLGMVSFALAGCLHDRPASSSSFADRFRMGGPTGPDAVFIDYALIERPAGSSEINRQIWTNVDEIAIDASTRCLLAENGIRAGVIGGMLPPELESMIANAKSDTGRRQRRLYVNNPASVQVNGPIPVAEYHYKSSIDADAKLETVHYEQARFSMTFTPSHAPDGKIMLHCVPEIEYQDKRSWLPTGAVASAWMGHKPIERCTPLSWELKLSPGEFLVIGSYYERGPWLGNQIFAGTQSGQKVQRLLVVRTGLLYPAEAAADANLASKDNILPLAAQATLSASRTKSP
jgi:hypothetical protein